MTRQDNYYEPNSMKQNSKVHSLTGRITIDRAHKAFKAVKRNRGAAGVDRVSIKAFEKNLEESLSALVRRLKDGSYTPLPVRRCHIPKGRNETRPLGIPAVRDRVAQEVLRSLLDPIFEPLFHNDSYGFRKGRSAHQAIVRVGAYQRDNNRSVLDADLKGFFDNIPHDLIVDAVAEKVADGNVLRLIRKFLTCGVMEDGVFTATRRGTPQGGVISPLLSNIVLNKLDWALHAQGLNFVRYADDFVILCKTRNAAERAKIFVVDLLDQMDLPLNLEKTRVGFIADSFEFLGFKISSHGPKIGNKAIERLKDKVRSHTIRSRNLDHDVIVRLNRVIRGTANYFAPAFANGAYDFRTLDKFIRRRVRSMKLTRIHRSDNYRIRTKHIANMGLLSLYDLYHAAKE